MQQIKLGYIVSLVALFLITVVIPVDGIGLAQVETNVTLPTVTLGIGDTSVIDAHIHCVEGCGGFTISIKYDPVIVRVDQVVIEPFLGAQVFEVENNIDNSTGQVVLTGAALTPPPTGMDDVLFQLTITVLAEGTSPLIFETLEIVDLTGTVMTSVAVDGSVTAAVAPGVVPIALRNSQFEIAFVSQRDGNPEIYKMNADGSNQLRLTNNPANDSFPVWSPDGSQIAFGSDRDGNQELYVMDGNGNNVRRLTNNAATDGFASWSPDGSQIAFVSDRDGNSEIYTMQADGTNVQRVTNDPANDITPAWSPSGTLILFVSDRQGASETFSMKVDGSNVQRVTNSFGSNTWYPDWAPNGNLIAFKAERDGQADIYTIDQNGANISLLQEDKDRVSRVTWSPDGQRLAFATGRDGNSEIYVMDIASKDVYRLTETDAEDFSPDWRPVSGTPCIVRTDQADITVRVGPGFNRAVFDQLPSSRNFSVIGQYTDQEGNLWWQIEKTQFSGAEQANSLWVMAAEVQGIGDCGMVMVAEPPPLIMATNASDNNTPSTGAWGACGSCETCGHGNECVLSPNNECLWDPGKCHLQLSDGGGDTKPGTCFTVSTSYVWDSGSTHPPVSGGVAAQTPFNCDGKGYQSGTSVTVAVTGTVANYFISWGGTCMGASGNSNPVTVTVNGNCTVEAHLYY